MHSLITFATQWGSKHGGINSFNTDFLKAFGIAFHQNVQVICIVESATDEDVDDARNAFVTLVRLPYLPQEKSFSATHVPSAIEQLKQSNITFEPANTVWLGHDRITGEIAIVAANKAGGRSALIHHMSYDAYESFAEDSQTASSKNQEQIKLFEQADLVLAIGPLLRDAAQDMIGQAQAVYMLIPGLAEEIEMRAMPKTFAAFLSGRLSSDAARIKQGHLGVAAFAHAHKLACNEKMPEGLYKQPKLTLRGVDFEAEVKANPNADPEKELKAFAEKYAERAINLHALPYTHNREELYDNISRSSVVLMPSWHEGFGLTAWEAIAAGVPLIVSEQSGVYRLLDEGFSGTGTGCVYPIDIHGSIDEPYFQDDDLRNVADALKQVANQPDKARQKAVNLRSLLIDRYTWSACAEEAAKAFSWELKKGSIPPIAQQSNIQPLNNVASLLVVTPSIVNMPLSSWKASAVVTDSQLLRAEEALVPFDHARQPDLDKLDLWLDDAQYPQAIRLVTGAGGLGKTRLALQLCQQRNSAGWHAGLLDSSLSLKDINVGWQVLKALNQPLLIVIDYAETRQHDLIVLLKAVLQNPLAHPVRVLLLARDGGEWWDNLPAKDKTCEPLLSSYATSGPYHIPFLHTEIQDRQRAYQAAMQAFAQALNGVVPDVMPDLSAEHFGRPLYLQMAALLALRGERPNSAQGLTRALLNHERRYWHGLLHESSIPEPERYAEQLLAIATLAGGFATAKDARSYWDQVDKEVLSPAQFNQLFDTLKPLYPSKQGLQAVRPDLLGEALVAKILQKPVAMQILQAVLGKDATSSVRLHALTVLARLSNHYPELNEILSEAFVQNFSSFWQEFLRVAKETPSDLPLLAEVAFTRLPMSTKSQLAGSLTIQMQPGESVQLAIFDCLVRGYLTDKLREKNRKKPSDMQVCCDFAGGLSNFAISLSNVGQSEEALACAKQALEIYQRLASENPDRFEADFATSLSNYASFLSEAGRNDEALNLAKRALAIRQRLPSKKNPYRFESDLAASLGNYANRLSDAGRNDEALVFAKQAFGIDQRLASKNPDRFESDFAASLSNYAHRLSEAGRIDEALAFVKQALEIRQRIASKNPDRFTEGWFSLRCYLYLLGWLINESISNETLAQIKVIPEIIPKHRQTLVKIWADFVQACCTSDPTIRSSMFERVATLWIEMSQANQITAQEYWLCAAAWCATHHPSAVIDIDWQVEWQKFLQRKQGNIPHWMLLVAERLDFQWVTLNVEVAASN